jgi:hypothetical protein
MTVLVLWLIDSIWPGEEQHIWFLNLFLLSVFSSAGFSLVIHYLFARLFGYSPILDSPITPEVLAKADLGKAVGSALALIAIAIGLGFFFAAFSPGEVPQKHGEHSVFAYLIGSVHYNYGIAWAMGSWGLLIHLAVVIFIRVRQLSKFIDQSQQGNNNGDS